MNNGMNEKNPRPFVISDDGARVFPLDEDSLLQAVINAYSLDRVSAHCIALQSTQGTDVTFLLAGIIAIEHKWCLDAKTWREVREAMEPWRDHVVAPLRAARRWLKHQDGFAKHPLRMDMQSLELKAEYEELRQIRVLLAKQQTFAMATNDAFQALNQALDLPAGAVAELKAAMPTLR